MTSTNTLIRAMTHCVPDDAAFQERQGWTYEPAPGAWLSPIVHLEGQPFMANVLIARASTRKPIEIAEISPAPNITWEEPHTLWCAWCLDEPIDLTAVDHDHVISMLMELLQPRSRFLPLTMGQQFQVPEHVHVSHGVPPWTVPKVERKPARRSIVAGMEELDHKRLRDDMFVRYAEMPAMWTSRTTGATAYIVGACARDGMDLDRTWAFMVRRAAQIGMVADRRRVSELHQKALDRMSADSRSPRSRRKMDSAHVQLAIIAQWIGEPVLRVMERLVSGSVRYDIELEAGDIIRLPVNLLRQQSCASAVLSTIKRLPATLSAIDWKATLEAIVNLAEPLHNGSILDAESWVRANVGHYFILNTRKGHHGAQDQHPYTVPDDPHNVYYLSKHLEHWARNHSPSGRCLTVAMIRQAMHNLGAFRRSVYHNGAHFHRLGLHENSLKSIGIALKDGVLSKYGTQNG